MVLKRAGYAVSESETTAQALRDITATRPDLVIMDLNVGSDSGVAAIEEIRRSQTIASTPVILVSGETEREESWAVAAGADAYLSKPFDIDVLTATARRLVDRPDA